MKNVPLADHADGDKKARKASKEAAGPLDPYAKMVGGVVTPLVARGWLRWMSER